jgi:hypothetical protein
MQFKTSIGYRYHKLLARQILLRKYIKEKKGRLQSNNMKKSNQHFTFSRHFWLSFWRLLKPYWQSEEKNSPIPYFF